MKPMKNMQEKRRTSRQIQLGGVAIGGAAPVSVQTMTNSDTRDVEATVGQVRAAMVAGCDIVRLAVPGAAAADALVEIRKAVPSVPLVADIHFDYRLALRALDAGVDGLRINPGNIGGEDNVRAVVRAARKRNTPIRIGVNAGSLEADIRERFGGPTPEAMVESALKHISLLEAEDYREIKVSVKASDVCRTVAAYRLLAERCDYPLHLGVTEAGTLLGGTVVSSVGIGILLAEGIGDTIRVSLTASPLEEVRVGLMILRSLGLREAGANVTSCPTCGRTRVNVEEVAVEVERRLELLYRERSASLRPHVAVMGCMVNGPGEAKEADIALVGGDGRFALYEHGDFVAGVDEADAVDALLERVKVWQPNTTAVEGAGVDAGLNGDKGRE